jgi:hypothetical protein
MNNNRQSNNRRRSRNNSNNRSNNNNRNGFDNQNRIDNRARGNAAQMLEKYKKLASDAQHNDDRVNAEYYLQFADHYFRVLADSKARQEEKQEGQQGRRQQNRDDARDDSHSDYTNRDYDRETAGDDKDDFEERSEVSAEINDTYDADDSVLDNRDASFEPEERQAREPQGRERQSRDRGPRGDGKKQRPRGEVRQPREQNRGEEQSGLDLSVLPPAISVSDVPGDEQAEKPARKPRARRPKANDDTEVAAAAE